MLTKRLLDLFRNLPRAIADAPGPLTPADRRAVLADLSHADVIEAGLGEKLAGFVVAGEGESVLLQVQALMTAPRPQNAPALWDVLIPSTYPYGDDKEAQEKHLAARRTVLFGLEGFDPQAMRRFGMLFAPFDAARQYRYGFPGSDRSPMWFRSLLNLRQMFHEVGKPHGITLPQLRALLAPDGNVAATLLDCAFRDGGEEFKLARAERVLDLPGLPDLLMEERDVVPAAVLALPAPARATVASFLVGSGLLARDPVFLDLTFKLVADGSKAVREAALAALAQAPTDQVEAKTTTLLASRAADERLAAVNVLARHRGAEALPALARHEATETSRKVLDAIATARATVATLAQSEADAAAPDGADGYTAADGSWVAAPPWQPAPDPGAPADTPEVFRALIQAANAAARRDYDAVPEAERDGKTWGRYGQVPARFEPPLDPSAASKIAAVMNGTARSASADAGVWHAVSVALPNYATSARDAYLPALRAFLDRPEVPVAALMRLALVGQNEHSWRYLVSHMLHTEKHFTEIGDAIIRRLRVGADLRDMVAAAEAQGFKVAEALGAMLGGYGSTSEDEEEEPSPTHWPVLAGHFPLLDRALTPDVLARHRYGADVVVGLLRLFPALPRRYVRYFLGEAVAGNVRTRNRARAQLKGCGDLAPVILDMLRSGEPNRRVGGARWLADRRDPATIPALRNALDAEKNVAAKAAILAALAACGDDVSDQFAEDRLLEEARTGLPKTKVDYSALFDPAALPALRWADGRAVPAEVVQWWFARAHKLKQPGGDPLMHLALDRLDRADAARLGQAVLSAFIQYDTRHPSSEDANAYARAQAPNWQNLWIGYSKPTSEEQAFTALRRAKLAEYLGSALDHRGLLALARHAPPAEAVASVKRYLRDHGKRANQCRALIDALAANPTPAVLQLILAASQRHKQPGTRKHAAEVAAGIAEEHGWTPAEMADRTIPTAGLDDDGVLELPIGERVFRARVAESKGGKGKGAKKGGAEAGLTLVVENPDGKAVAALPSPSDPAEAEEAKAAKKAVSAAKKELAQTVQSQTARLYEAMCTGRTWPVGDFRAFLLEHPLVGRLLRRLVLAGFDAEGTLAGSFRALDDGSLTDVEDASVSLDGFSSVGIAHAVLLGSDAAQAWAAHLSDYEVQPLFEQLDRPALAATEAAATEIKDREGWMIDTFALRSAATALGYGRGSIEDGGSFWSYDKPFPELGLAARIAFTGSFVPESERRPGALRELSFARLRRNGTEASGRGSVALGKVPPVLLSEAWNDLHAVAAAGTGFDPDWEKKAGW